MTLIYGECCCDWTTSTLEWLTTFYLITMYGSQSYGQQNHYHTNIHSAPPAQYPQHSRHGYQQGGHRDHYQQGPPPGVDPQLWQWFSAVDSDRSGSISVTELQTALINGQSSWVDYLVIESPEPQETGQVSELNLAGTAHDTILGQVLIWIP